MRSLLQRFYSTPTRIYNFKHRKINSKTKDQKYKNNSYSNMYNVLKYRINESKNNLSK